jgi:hypothetical protein
MFDIDYRANNITRSPACACTIPKPNHTASEPDRGKRETLAGTIKATRTPKLVSHYRTAIVEYYYGKRELNNNNLRGMGMVIVKHVGMN